MKIKYKIDLVRHFGMLCGMILTGIAAFTAVPGLGAGHGKIAALIAGKTPESAKNVAHGENPAPPIAMSVSFRPHGKATRFTLELSAPASVRTFTLSAPNRLVLDMPKLAWKLTNPPKPDGKGLIRSYRYGLFRAKVSRFVIDLKQPVHISHPVLLPPQNGLGYRIVIDLEPTTQANFNRGAGWPGAAKTQPAAAPVAEVVADYPIPQRNPLRRIVVIDPGHGGVDDGTTGINGKHEKNLVLAEGHYVADELEARGYTVYMTRSDDTFIPLGKRVQMARDWHADLFISIHADSNPDASVSGLSIYTLSDKGSDQAARMLAAKENRSDIVAGVNLSGDAAAVAPILIDLAQRDSINKSSRFAETALNALRPVTAILAHTPHRSAAFRVLKAPDMPAVLIELGYLSNRQDAARMRTNYWRKRVAKGIATAVDRYFGHTDNATE